jgi:hypothetical protein
VHALPRAASAKRVQLFVDAGWMTDWDDPNHRIGAATIPDREVWKRGRTFWSASFDPDCEAAMASDPSACFMAPNWYSFVSAKLPVLIQQCSIDASFTGVHRLMPANVTDPAVMAWQAQVKASFQSANIAWLFSGGTTPYHTLAPTDQGMQTGPSGNELKDVLGHFLAGASPQQVTF